MRVALISHLASAAAPTGAERILVEVATRLLDRSHAVTVLSPGGGAAGAELQRHRVPVRVEGLRQCWLSQPRRQPVGMDALRFLRWSLPGGGGRGMRKWLASIRPDIVYVNCVTNVTASAVAANLRLPVLWHVHEIVAQGWRRRFLARRLRRDATRIVAVSEAVAGWLREEGLGDRVTVVHNGVEAPAERQGSGAIRRRMGLPEEWVLVGCFGQLIGHKGVLDLVAAAAELGPEVGVVLAGSGSPRFVRELERAIARGPGVVRVRLLPPQPDAWELLAAVDVVAVPSRWPDPLPRIVMEAMAVGRPVVASDGGGIPEMVVDGETGFLVPPGDVVALADRLRRLAADAELRRRFGGAGAERARREFSLARHVDRMEALLAEAAGSARGRR